MKKLRVVLFGAALLVTGCSTGKFYYDAPPLPFADVHYGFPTKHATVNGINLHYIDEGKGEKTLLLVHGLASNAGFWRYNIPELSANYRVIAVDLPGRGKSDKGVYSYSMTFCADILSGLLQQLNIDKVYYCGHSMGGQIGIDSEGLGLGTRVHFTLPLAEPSGQSAEENERERRVA